MFIELIRLRTIEKEVHVEHLRMSRNTLVSFLIESNECRFIVQIEALQVGQNFQSGCIAALQL